MKMPRLMPLVAIAAGGVLAINAVENGPGIVGAARSFAEGVSGNLYDCGTGLEASMRYLKHAVTLYGAGCEAASAYNTGLSGRGRCTGYGRRAMRLAQLLK